MVRAFEDALNTPVTLSPTTVMGAIGAVLLAHEYMGDKMKTDPPTSKTER
jgi:activator of 2-hydroxyglutaryl-CoA dehydratase